MILKILLKKWRFFLFPILTIFFSVVLIFLVVIPRLTISLSLVDKIDERSKFLANLVNKQNDLNGLDENLLKEKVDLFLSALPGEKNFLKIVATVNQLAEGSRVVIQNLEVSPGEVATETAQLKPSAGESLTFQIKVLGEQSDVEDFLTNVEEALPIFIIRTVKVNNSSRASQAQLIVENFFAQYPLTLGKISAPLVKPSKEDDQLYETLKKMRSYSAESLDITGTSAKFVRKGDPFSSE